MGQKVDLHIHSLYSDGRCRIPEIMQIIKKEAITVFAITDHDTVDGIQEARDAAGSSVKCIAGIEFTCREQRFSASGKYKTESTSGQAETWSHRSVRPALQRDHTNGV